MLQRFSKEMEELCGMHKWNLTWIKQGQNLFGGAKGGTFFFYFWKKGWNVYNTIDLIT